MSRATHLARFLIFFSLITVPAFADDTEAQQPSQASQLSPEAVTNHAAMLDKLLSEHNYNELGAKMLHPTDASLIRPTLEWAKARTFAGASVIVPLLYSKMLWEIGSANPQFADFKGASAVMTLYAFLVALADGPKCADQSALNHHLETIILKYHSQLQFISQAPDDTKNRIINAAFVIEVTTLALRDNDDYLCRFGLQEIQDSLQKNGPGKEVQSQPAHVAKTVMVDSDPTFVPKFLPRDQWEAKQTAARKQFLTTLVPLIGNFKLPIADQVAKDNLIKKVEPIYPALAKNARVQGTVEFTATISKDGEVISLQLVRGHPLLVNAARDAVSQWRYKPITVNGQPVEVITDIAVNFSLSQ